MVDEVKVDAQKLSIGSLWKHGGFHGFSLSRGQEVYNVSVIVAQSVRRSQMKQHISPTKI